MLVLIMDLETDLPYCDSQICFKVISHYIHINLDIYKHMYFLSVMLCQ